VKKGGDTGVIVKIADLVRDKVLTEISDLEDHSDRTGMRIQIELKRDAIPQVALNKLFKHTPLQSTFGVNNVALVDGVPRTALAARARHALPRLPARGRLAARRTSCARRKRARTSSRATSRRSTTSTRSSLSSAPPTTSTRRARA
jgi:hypothetical protein